MKSFLRSSSCVLAVMAATPALAQGTDSATDTRSDTGGLEEIVVTAQKRSERLQDVPIAIAAVTSQTMAQANIRTTGNLPNVVPGLVTYQTVTSFQPFLRGVGSAIASLGLENPVAVYIDGVYLSSKASSVFGLGAVERIEVIKGPQGTLFGRNATGGAISVTTRDPGSELGASAEVGYGRFEEVTAKGAISVPITDTLSVMASGSYRKDDGYIKDIIGGGTVGTTNEYAAMAKVVWSPSDRFDLKATYLQYGTSSNAANMVHLIAGKTIAFPPGTIVATGRYQSSWDFVPYLKARSKVAIARMRYGVSDDVDIVSISSYQKLNGRVDVDPDRTSLKQAYAIQAEASHSYSQEIQVMSTGTRRLSWIGGLFYYKNKASMVPIESRAGLSRDFNLASLSGIPFVSPSITRFRGQIPTTSYAAFAQATLAVGDSGHLTAGLRYTADKKSLTNQVYYIDKTGAELPIAGRSSDTSKKYKKLTWRLSYDHKITDDVLVYASYNRGFKAGGYNPTLTATAAGQPLPVEPETLDAYEIGIKSELFDRRLRANISAFYYDYKDILVSTVDPVRFLSAIENAASARIYGLDFDVNAAVTDSFSLRASATYLHAKYQDFKTASASIQGPTGAAISVSRDASGTDVVFAPKVTLTLGADYSLPLSDSSRLVLSTTYYYNDGFLTQAVSPLTAIPSWSNLAASATFRFQDDKYFIRVWGDNLTNDKHPFFRLGAGTGFGEINVKPVTYGVTAGFNF